MRTAFSNSIEKFASENANYIFITGDLGFNALESLRIKLGKRFINAGVAEQSMISMAAGMASNGHVVIVYSISPFIVFRALEQIRNDICFHNLPVLLVGNGGGYGYGIMGATHHAIQDISLMSAMPNMKIMAPSTNRDVEMMLRQFSENPSPTYLRLMAGNNNEYGNISQFRKVTDSNTPKVTVLCLGSSINNLIENPRYKNLIPTTDLFVCNILPVNILEPVFVESISRTKKLVIIEENVIEGGLASQVSVRILQSGLKLTKFKTINAIGYPGNIYGSQKFHQVYSGLDGDNIVDTILEIGE